MELKADGNTIKVYVMISSSGEYEDYREHNIICYMNKEKAEAEVARLDKELEEYKIQCAKDIENYNSSSSDYCSSCEAQMECDDCEFHVEIDYNYDEQHGYHLQEIDLVL